MTDLYLAQHEGLITVHRALADAFAPIAAGEGSALDALVQQTKAACGFLLAHHEIESTGLFPGLRRHGRLRSSDVAFLDARDREHHELHAICERLLATASAPHPVAATLASLARDLTGMLAAHTREEEAGLAPDQLRHMIAEAALAELGRELEALRPAIAARLGR